MKLKPFFISFFFFTVLYFGLIIITGPFLISWGAERNFFEKMYAKFIGGPFSYGKSLWLILINAFFWHSILYLFIFILLRIKRKDRN